MAVEAFHSREQQRHGQGEHHHRSQHQPQETRVGDNQIALSFQYQSRLIHEQPEFEQMSGDQALCAADGSLIRSAAEHQQHTNAGENTDWNQARESGHAEIDLRHSR